ncbi:hypothetical protein EFM11_02495 [Lactobacillus helveticus]|nr:hypothetical protein [Lactobacillus helveticus]
MDEFHCPECKSNDVSPISINNQVATFGLVALGKAKLPHGSLHVNLIHCNSCGFTWIKLTDRQLEILNKHQD